MLPILRQGREKMGLFAANPMPFFLPKTFGSIFMPEMDKKLLSKT
jgi:hypothetical protein